MSMRRSRAAEPAAREARLTIMAGGVEAAFARAHPILAVLGSRITRVGDVGAGQVAKAADRVIVALTIGAVAEALAAGQARRGRSGPGSRGDPRRRCRSAHSANCMASA